MEIYDRLLTPKELAERWAVSTKKLDADRLRGTGIPFMRIGRLVRYRLSDVERYEQANLRTSTSDEGGSHA